jgi:hypothetical protein
VDIGTYKDHRDVVEEVEQVVAAEVLALWMFSN